LKKLILTVWIVIVLGLLIAGFTAPIFAHGPDDGGATPANEGAWEAMHEACESGDWEAMAEFAEEVHEEGSDYMPCHDEDHYDGGHMGRGMMGW